MCFVPWLMTFNPQVIKTYSLDSFLAKIVGRSCFQINKVMIKRCIGC